jgi:hypothetical protein
MGSKVYAMPLVERGGSWSFRIMIEGQMVQFGPYLSKEEALEVRQLVLRKPQSWKSRGGRRDGSTAR